MNLPLLLSMKCCIVHNEYSIFTCIRDQTRVKPLFEKLAIHCSVIHQRRYGCTILKPGNNRFTCIFFARNTTDNCLANFCITMLPTIVFIYTCFIYINNIFWINITNFLLVSFYFCGVLLFISEDFFLKV